MAEISFCRQTKDKLREISTKKGCCRKTVQKLSEALSYPANLEEAVKVGDRVICRDCVGHFLRLLFIEYGTVNDPEKSFHLEMSFPDEAFRDYVYDKIRFLGLEPKKRRFRSKYTVYFKDSEAIVDFFADIGENTVAFDMMNLQLVKEVRKSVNRITNFETANMKKAVLAGGVYIDAINWLCENGKITQLPDELKLTAQLRCDNPDLSLPKLAELHTPAITKSGVKHRLDKILDFYNKMKAETADE